MSLTKLEELLSNKLGTVTQGTTLVGIIGDQPSSYAKSPAIWNPTLKALGLNAAYLPFDVPSGRLGEVVAVLREMPKYPGGNVTVPYKVEIVQYLDRLDPLAEAIGAVNTIARDETGALVGYNTDGQGAVDALIHSQSDHTVPFIESLTGQQILLVGAGGAARAVAFYLGQHIGGGRLWIANRTIGHATNLEERLSEHGFPAKALAIDEIQSVMADVTLLVNATSVGQSGLRSLPNGEHTILEPYSPLAPFIAEPVANLAPESMQNWAMNALDGIESSTCQAWRLMAQLPPSARCFDLIYSPLESTFLQQARLSGHATMNGKAMNVCQAVSGFIKVMQPWLSQLTEMESNLYERVQTEMYQVWN